MRIPWLCSIVVIGAAVAFGQSNSVTTPPPMSTEVGGTLTITGCVARSDKSDPIMLTHAMVLPSGTPALTPELASAAEWFRPQVDPSRVSSGATQQQSPAEAGGTPPARSAIPGAVGTSGTIVGTAPAGSSASSVDGYRLSGVDMTSWIGHRVQLIGLVIPAARRTQADAVERGEGVDFSAVPEFRVVSVQPVTGPCPKR